MRLVARLESGAAGRCHFPKPKKQEDLILKKHGCAMLLASLLALSFQVSAMGQTPIQVVATNFPCYDFARAVAGERAEVTMLLPPGSESHSFEPTPRDILTVQGADVFIYAGGEGDAWVGGLLENMERSGKQDVALIDLVDAVEEENIEGMQIEERHEEYGHDEEEAELDEHVWTAPSNAKVIVLGILGELVEADPAGGSVYRENAAAYCEEIDALDGAFQEVTDHAARRTLVFADRFPFRYLADAYGLTCFAAFPGCATETEPSARTVAFLIDKVKEEGIPVVFHIELSNEKMADTICEATGAAKRLLHACHNISRDDFENGETYVTLMAKNVEALREALS